MQIKKLSSVLFGFFALLLAACSSLLPSARPMPSQAEIDREEQAVYATFFRDIKGPAILLLDTATDISPDSQGQNYDYVRSGLKSLSRETLDNFQERNRQPGRLAPDMQLGVEYVLLSPEHLSAIFQQPNSWEVFYRKYSDAGYSEFSRVGFNRSLDQALVYMGHMSGPLAGAGNYYLMEKTNGQWEIKEQVMVWIS